jgi:hypothetical protein
MSSSAGAHHGVGSGEIAWSTTAAVPGVHGCGVVALCIAGYGRADASVRPSLVSVVCCRRYAVRVLHTYLNGILFMWQR